MLRYLVRTAAVLMLLAAFVQAAGYKLGGYSSPLGQGMTSSVNAARAIDIEKRASTPQPQLGQGVSSSAQKTAKDDENRTVYITRTGKKYHGPNCSYLRQSKIPISLKEARKRGYTACSRCGGR